jgi:hypothetical protein
LRFVRENLAQAIRAIVKRDQKDVSLFVALALLLRTHRGSNVRVERSPKGGPLSNAWLDLILHNPPRFTTTSKISHQARHFPLYFHDEIVRHTCMHLKLDVALVLTARLVDYGIRIQLLNKGKGLAHGRPPFEVHVEINQMRFREIEPVLFHPAKYVAINVIRPIHLAGCDEV